MQNLTITIDETEKQALEAQAAGLGITPSELLRRGAAVLGDFSPYFANRLAAFCRQHRLPASLVIENLLLGRMADLEARADVWGESPKVMPEFQSIATGPLTGAPLFTILKAQKVAELETEKEAFLRRKARETRLTGAESRWLASRAQPVIDADADDDPDMTSTES